MYKKDDHLTIPDENDKIWRYVDFSKFLSLLEDSAIFFSRADKLDDPFEGSYSKVNIKVRPITYQGWSMDDLGSLSDFRRLLPIVGV